MAIRRPSTGRLALATYRVARLVTLMVVAVIPPGCTDRADESPPTGLLSAAYDPETGRLRLIEYDADENGTVDTWTYMDGSRLLRIELDRDEDGRLERWEYYDDARRLEKVGMSSAGDGIEDTWAYHGPDGQVTMLEVSNRRDGTVDRWQYYEGGVLVRAEQDTTADGVVDKWERFENGHLVAMSLDTNGDGRPDRRMNYDEHAALVSIESEPDASGEFTKTITPPGPD